MSKILLVEDEAGIAQGLEYQLLREGYEVTWAQDGREALEAFLRHGADLVLLDLMLPGMSGEDVCRELRRGSDVPIIMLTARDTDIDKIVGLELGADDYVTKPFNTRELIARIKAVLRRAGGSTERSSGVIEGGPIRLDAERFEVTLDGEQVHLPRKEFELLEILMENQGRVLTRETLIDQIWGPDYFGDTRTLDTHIGWLRKKVEDGGGVRIVAVRGLGYRLDLRD